jgi:eukaryotic-like serine/threonine-protein kinase
MTASNDDFLFAQEAQALGYVTEVQVEEGFKLQRIMSEELKIDERLDVILVKRGWLAEEQARRVHARVEPEGKKAEIPGYQLLERIGRGAMGTVYKARHLSLQRFVAIKVLHKELAADRTQVERLKAEAKLLASLDHPNIIRALDAGEANGFPYVVMEYVEGETLRERLQRERVIPEAEALRITRGLADALERARRMGVVHRDVKPGNVLLTRQGAPKLMDLGLAKGPVDLDLTQHGATVGTPQYISPEQAQDPRKADIRSDIYSLGATLYALVTGRPPFEGTTLAEILSKVLYETPTPPRVLNPEVSAEVGYLIERMMLKDPSLRYHTPAEVVLDIDKILDGRSIMPAGFRGNWEAFLLRRRIRRWSKVAILAAALAIGLGVTVHALVRRQAEENEREEARVQVAVLLPEVQTTNEDTQHSVHVKLGNVENLLARIESLSLPEARFLATRRDHLRALYETFQAWHRLMGDAQAPVEAPNSVTALVRRSNYRAALERVKDFEQLISPPGPDNPVALLAQKQKGHLRLASAEEFKGLQNWVRAQRPAELEDWAGVLKTFHEKAQAGFILEAEAKDGVAEASNLHTMAQGILGAVKEFESSYKAEVVAERLSTLNIAKLQDEVQEKRRTVTSLVERVWRDAAATWTPTATLLGYSGLVSGRLDELVRRSRMQVVDHVERAIAEAHALQAKGQEGEAIEALAALWFALKNGKYFDLAKQVDDARAEVLAESGERVKRARALYDELLARWLSDLASLQADTPRALDLDLTPDQREILGAKRAALEALRPAGAAVDRLYPLAMEALSRLAATRKPLVARLRPAPGSTLAVPAKGWPVVSVDAEARTFDVASGEREPLRLSLFALAPASIVELARRTPVAPEDRFALAVGALALLPMASTFQDPDSEVRWALPVHDDVRTALEQAGERGALSEYVGQRLAAVKKLSDDAESRGASFFDNAQIAAAQGRWSAVRYYLAELLRSPRLRTTKFVSENDPRIRELLRWADKELGKENMGRWLPGVHAVQLPSGAWQILYDFDTEEQIQAVNFAAGKGVLEPYSGRAVTPKPGVFQRLHLLRGFSEPSRDHPLVWRSIFDPAAPITVEFDLYPLDRPFLLAVDVDGVQVAVLSLDPNWFPEFRLPPDAPPLEGEKFDKKAPPLDWFGRGRGVAFHGGPDFGDIPAWSAGGRAPGSAWTPEGRGQHHFEWLAKPEQLERLFAFPPEAQTPGRPVHRVKVHRDKGTITLFVNGHKVTSETRTEWARFGTGAGMVNGTGNIQILTWTPVAIDDLTFTGMVKSRWLADQQKKDKDEAAREAAPAPQAPAPR